MELPLHYHSTLQKGHSPLLFKSCAGHSIDDRFELYRLKTMRNFSRPQHLRPIVRHSGPYNMLRCRMVTRNIRNGLLSNTPVHDLFCLLRNLLDPVLKTDMPNAPFFSTIPNLLSLLCVASKNSTMCWQALATVWATLK